MDCEQEKEQLKHDAKMALRYGNMNQNVLNYFIEKSFHLGHNVGEGYKRRYTS